MNSYPTPSEAANIERMNAGFLKLHPGAPIHYFTECQDEFYHTHPFNFTTHIIEGGYREEVLVQAPDGTWSAKTFERLPGTSHDLRADQAHKLVGLLGGPCITRCEYGPTVQTPGFIDLLPNGSLLHRFHNEHTWMPYRSHFIKPV